VVHVLAVAARHARGGRPGRVERQVYVAAALLAAASACPADRITFVDVGQGDCTLLEGGGGAVLVDSGPPPLEGEAPAALGAVRRRRVRPLDALVLTHAHADHAGGAAALLRSGRVRTLVSRPDCVEGAPALAEIARLARERGVPMGAPGAHPLPLLAGRVTVLDPFGGAPPPEAEENDRSLAAIWRARGAAALLLGDGGVPPQEALQRAGTWPRAPILMLPHHGSRGATGAPLLAGVGPRLAIVSCGAGNPHRHPHAETLERVAQAGVALLRTDLDGTIAITATRRGFRVRWTRGYPGPRALFPAFPLPGPAGIP
jgi:competence protein ComEC